MAQIATAAKTELSPFMRRRITESLAIEGKLKARGITKAEIDRTYKLPDGTARNTLRVPHRDGERAIAAALATRPELLWPTRYHAGGQRKSQLDYTPMATLAQRRNGAGA